MHTHTHHLSHLSLSFSDVVNTFLIVACITSSTCEYPTVNNSSIICLHSILSAKDVSNITDMTHSQHSHKSQSVTYCMMYLRLSIHRGWALGVVLMRRDHCSVETSKLDLHSQWQLISSSVSVVPLMGALRRGGGLGMRNTLMDACLYKSCMMLFWLTLPRRSQWQWYPETIGHSGEMQWPPWYNGLLLLMQEKCTIIIVQWEYADPVVIGSWMGLDHMLSPLEPVQHNTHYDTDIYCSTLYYIVTCTVL